MVLTISMRLVIGKYQLPMKVAFFLCTAAWNLILMLDNLMRRGLLLANQCCIFQREGESVVHHFLHCDVAHALWGDVLQLFGIYWVMPESEKNFFIFLEKLAWETWFGYLELNSGMLDVDCLEEKNRCSFDNSESSMDQLKSGFHCTLFDCSRCLGFADCFSPFDFPISLGPPF